MAKVGTFKKEFVGIGALIVIGIIGSTMSSGYISKETVSGDMTITVTAETQKQIEASLVGDKKSGTFSVGDGKFVFVERR